MVLSVDAQTLPTVLDSSGGTLFSVSLNVGVPYTRVASQALYRRALASIAFGNDTSKHACRDICCKSSMQGSSTNLIIDIFWGSRKTWPSCADRFCGVKWSSLCCLHLMARQLGMCKGASTYMSIHDFLRVSSNSGLHVPSFLLAGSHLSFADQKADRTDIVL